MAQNEITEPDAGPIPSTWRIDLEHLALWQFACLVVLGFLIGAAFGLVVS